MINQIFQKIQSNTPNSIRRILLKEPFKIILIKIRGYLIHESVYYKNAILPAKQMRHCGIEFRDDKYYLDSAQGEANRLKKSFGLALTSRVLDVGCGRGRLAIGIYSKIGEIRNYSGIDVNKSSIRWCQRYITRYHPHFQFIHIDAKNIRYNPDGQLLEGDFRFPFEDETFDIIYLYSVFSHMTIDDIRVYLKEFKRLLVPSGKCFLTGFFEEGTPEMSINPKDYKKDWSGPLHCVRYNRSYFEGIVKEHGFVIDEFRYEKEANSQSAFYLTKSPI